MTDITGMTFFLNIIAIFLSLIALFVSLSIKKISKRQYEIDKTVQIESKFIDIEMKIEQEDSLLKFHGVSEDDLSKAQITSSEFSYLLSNFTAGSIKSRAHGLSIEEVDITTYRMDMLKEKATRKAWPVIRKLMSETSYRNKIDEIVSELNSLDIEKNPC